MTSLQWPPREPLVSPWGRIELVSPEDKDDPKIVALRTHPESRRYPPPTSPDLLLELWRTTRQARLRNVECWDLNIKFTSEYTVANKDIPGGDPFIGVCGIFRINREMKTTDIGILIRPDLYRLFIATETLYCLFVAAFEHPQLQLYRVEVITGVTNIRMRGWLDRFGLLVESIKKEALSDGEGGRLDAAVYAILKPNWPALKARLKEELDTRLSKS